MFLPYRLCHLYPCQILEIPVSASLFAPTFKHLFPSSSWCGCDQILETSLVPSLLRPVRMLVPVQMTTILHLHGQRKLTKHPDTESGATLLKPVIVSHQLSLLVVPQSSDFTSVFTILHTVFLYDPILPFITWSVIYQAMISSSWMKYPPFTSVPGRYKEGKASCSKTVTLTLTSAEATTKEHPKETLGSEHSISISNTINSRNMTENWSTQWPCMDRSIILIKANCCKVIEVVLNIST